VAQRVASDAEATRRNNDKLSQSIRVAIPATVVSFNPQDQTITAKPNIREKLIDRTSGQQYWQELPVLPKVPVCFPQAGNFVLTMPVQPGDEVLLVFTDMCMDSWWANGGLQNWIDRRRHDLSDAIAVCGVNSVPNVIPNIANNATELRTKDGNTKVRVQGDTVSMVAGSNSVTVSPSGINIMGTLKINNSPYLLHTHADPVSGTTGPVQPAPPVP
jgi:hypothetical protein